MDKESLALLLSAVSERYLIDLYRLKNVNNLGFRASHVDDIKRNRAILENNLLKPVNLRILDKHMVSAAAKIEMDTEALSEERIEELCAAGKGQELLTVLYVENKRKELEIAAGKLKAASRHHEAVEPAHSMRADINDTENKLRKKIQRLELKIEQMHEAEKVKEAFYKNQIQNFKSTIQKLQAENQAAEKNYMDLAKENEYEKRRTADLQSRNAKQQQSYLELRKTNAEQRRKIQLLREEIDGFKKEMNAIASEKTAVRPEPAADPIEKRKYEIIIFGEDHEKILRPMPNVQLRLIAGQEMETFFRLNSEIYDEIWVIQYDLNQKEKRTLRAHALRELSKTDIIAIHTLKELEQAQIDLENRIRGV